MAVETVIIFRYLGIHNSGDLKWTTRTDTVVKSARQCLFFLSRLKRFRMDSRILYNFYLCSMESILAVAIMASQL